MWYHQLSPLLISVASIILVTVSILINWSRQRQKLFATGIVLLVLSTSMLVILGLTHNTESAQVNVFTFLNAIISLFALLLFFISLF